MCTLFVYYMVYNYIRYLFTLCSYPLRNAPFVLFWDDSAANGASEKRRSVSRGFFRNAAGPWTVVSDIHRIASGLGGQVYTSMTVVQKLLS